jgi:hypothetical protein
MQSSSILRNVFLGLLLVARRFMRNCGINRRLHLPGMLKVPEEERLRALDRRFQLRILGTRNQETGDHVRDQLVIRDFIVDVEFVKSLAIQALHFRGGLDRLVLQALARFVFDRRQLKLARQINHRLLYSFVVRDHLLREGQNVLVRLRGANIILVADFHIFYP